MIRNSSYQLHYGDGGGTRLFIVEARAPRLVLSVECVMVERERKCDRGYIVEGGDNGRVRCVF